MWPFKTKENDIPIPEKAIEQAFDELGLVRLNRINDAIEKAIRKQLDPENLDEYGGDDGGGFFQPEFNLVGSGARMKALYKREPWVYTTISLISRTLASIPYDVVNKQTGEIDKNHPLNQILNSANLVQDKMTMDWSGNIDLVAAGNYFLAIQDQKVIHIPVEYVQLRLAKTNDAKHPIEGIDVTSSFSGGSASYQATFIPWDNVIHFKLPNPSNPFVGMSMITAASRPILLDRHKNEFELAFYLRGATNAGVIETTEDITKQRMERLMRTFESAFTGRRNWFRQLFLPKGAKWVNAGLTMAEMEHLEGLRENRLTLLAVLGVPPMKVGIVQDVNRATAETQDKTFYENTIIPLSKMKAAGWNNSNIVRNLYKGEVEVIPNFDGIEAVEGGLITRGERAKAVDNIATINEQRQIAKLPPLKASDPRGNMFLVELTSKALNPFADAMPTTTRPEDLGPEEDGTPQGPTHTVEVGEGDGEEPHTHMAEIDDVGNGKTTETIGETEDHEHEILNGEVQPSGTDGHSHPNIDLEAQQEQERTFQRVKQQAIGVQESIETSQGRQYYKALSRNMTVKLEQARQGLNQGVSDMRSWLTNGVGVRLTQYQDDGEKVLQETLGRGFTFGQTQTRNFKSTKVKVYNFSPADEVAIQVIRERTEDEQRRTLKQRNIKSFFGFDSTSTEQIMKVVEDGLKQGKTTEQIAKTIAKDWGENYGDQAFTITRTETLYAVSQGLQWQHDALNEVFSEVNKQWFHVGDVGSNPDARATHAGFENDGKKGVVPSDYEWVDEDGSRLRYPRDPNGSAKSTINCRCSMVSVIPKTAQSNADQILGRT